MELILEQKRIPAKTPAWLKKFFYSDAYIVVLAAAVFAGWYTKIPLVPFLLGSLLAMTALITLDDFMPMMPVILFAPCIFATKDPAEYWLQALGFLPLVFGLIFHFVYYRPEPKKMRMIVPQLLIAAAMLLGGFGVIPRENYLGTLAYNIMLGFLPLAFYLLNGLYSKKNEYVGFGRYFAKVSVWYGILLGAEVVATYIIKQPALDKLGAGFAVDLGWGIDNNVATILLLASPMAFYLASVDKYKVFYTVLGILNFAFTIITFSRGGILFGTAGAIVTVLIALKTNFGKDRLKIFIPCAVAVAAVAAVYIAFMDDINAHIVKLINIDDTGVSGRDKLFAEAIDAFRSNPWFGVGLGFDGEYYNQPVGMNFYWFHSTLFQILGCTGIVGLIAYGIFYIVRYGIVLRRIETNKFALYAFIGFICFEAYSFMDTGTFIPYPIMVYAMLMNQIVEFTNDETAAAKKRAKAVSPAV